MAGEWELVAQRGAQGVQGLTGPQGPLGPTGPQGEVGAEWFSTYVTGTSYDADDLVEWHGSTFIARNTGALPAPPELTPDYLPVTGPAGPTGATGATEPVPARVFYPETYGADPTGVSDSTAAFLAMFSDLRADSGGRVEALNRYKTSAPLVIDFVGLTWVGDGGFGAGQLVNNTSDMFTVASGYGVSFEGARFVASAGHIFNASAAIVSFYKFTAMWLIQQNTGKSIWHQPTGEMIDCTFEYCNYEHVAGATVSAWNVRSDDGGFSSNTWRRFRATHSGSAPFFTLASDILGSYANDNVIKEGTFELTLGGNVRLLSTNNTLLEELNTYDNPAGSTNDLYVLGKSASGPIGQNTKIRNCRLRATTALAAGKYHVKMLSHGRVTIDDCDGPFDLGFQPTNLYNIPDGTVFDQVDPLSIVRLNYGDGITSPQWTWGEDAKLGRTAVGVIETPTEFAARDLWPRRHIVAKGPAPTALADIAAGAGAVASVQGTDVAGIITLTTGAVPTAGELMHLVFASPYTGINAAPTLSPANAAAAANTIQASPATSAAQFQIYAQVAPLATTTYQWYYNVIGYA